MSTASLALLKGKNKTSTVAAELDKETPTAETPAAAAPKGKISIGKKTPTPTPVPEEPEAPQEEVVETVTEAVAETPAEGEAVEVDVDKMSAKDLDALVEEHAIEVPDEWKGWKVGEKRSWLNSQFEQASEEAQATPVPDAPAETPASTKAVATTGKSKTPAKAAKALSGEILQPDALSDMVSEIENLKENETKPLIHSLAETAEFTYFKLGGVLSVVQANGWFQPYASFREYLEQEHGIAYRKGMYWIGIYNDLTEAKVPWEKVKALGWSKLAIISGILNPENVDKWVEIASKNINLQLSEIVANSKKEGAPKAVEDQSSKNVTTKTFKVHDDQKKTIDSALEKAKTESGTDVDTAALEFLCLDYIGGGKKLSLKDQLKNAGVEKALEALGDAFPDVDFSVNLPDDQAA